MFISAKPMLACTLAVFGAASLCMGCGQSEERDSGSSVVSETSDTAIVRLRISNMTCATCPPTARLALKRLSGVHDAVVTLRDSLGLVQYDPRRLTPDQIASHLTRLTGYPARVLPDTAGARSKPRVS
jgi:copper chaperone CopZ